MNTNTKTFAFKLSEQVGKKRSDDRPKWKARPGLSSANQCSVTAPGYLFYPRYIGPGWYIADAGDAC